jgi:hypothetical protein
MKGLMASCLFTILMGAGLQAMADDPPSSSDSSSTPTMNTHQMMKDCMAKQKAANNGMSVQDMRKSCKDQIKAKVDHPDDSQPVVPAH